MPSGKVSNVVRKEEERSDGVVVVGDAGAMICLPPRRSLPYLLISPRG